MVYSYEPQTYNPKYNYSLELLESLMTRQFGK